MVHSPTWFSSMSMICLRTKLSSLLQPCSGPLFCHCLLKVIFRHPSMLRASVEKHWLLCKGIDCNQGNQMVLMPLWLPTVVMPCVAVTLLVLPPFLHRTSRAFDLASSWAVSHAIQLLFRLRQSVCVPSMFEQQGMSLQGAVYLCSHLRAQPWCQHPDKRSAHT